MDNGSMSSRLLGVAAAILCYASLGAAAQPVGTISTIAGGNASGEGASALSMTINGLGIAVDAQGRIYIAEPKANRVRMVRSDGTIETIAGTGVAGFSGDGGSARAAQLSAPDEVTVDAAGNIYVSDAGNFRIRRIAADGTITTFAGNGTAGFGGDGGPATAAQFGAGLWLAIDDSGALLVSDPDNRRVRRISGGIVTTVAGNGVTGNDVPLGDGGPATAARLVGPQGIVSDGAGGFYVVDSSDMRVRRVTSAGTITTFAGVGGFNGPSGNGVPATSVVLMAPYGVARDAAGNVYISQVITYGIRRVGTDGIISAFAGHPQNFSGVYSGDGGLATEAGISTKKMVFHAGSLYFAQYVGYYERSRVRRIDPSGIVDAVAGLATGEYSGDGPDALKASLTATQTIAFPSGDLYVRDYQTLRHVTPAGAISTLAGPIAREMLVDPQGNLYYITDRRVRKRTPDGVDTVIAGRTASGQAGDGGLAVNASFISPNYLAMDREGNLYVGDVGYPYTGEHGRIRRIDAAGIISTVAGGKATLGADGEMAAQAGIAVGRMAVDAQNRLLVVDQANHRVRRIEPSGALSTLAGTGTAGHAGDGGSAAAAQLHWPYDIAADPSGNIYIAELGYENPYATPPEFEVGGRAIRRIAWDTGIIETLAGNGTKAYGGENVPAVGSPLASPQGVTSDGARAILITEFGTGLGIGSRVRKLIVGDGHPDAFAFGIESGVVLGSARQSSSVTPAGFDIPSGVLVSGGEYSVGCTATFTSAPGTLTPGQSICVRHTASALHNDIVTTRLTVGGRTGTFTSRTGVGPGSVSIAPPALDFGTQLANVEFPAKASTLTNTGAASVTIHEIVAPAGFQVSHDCGTLAAGATCTAQVLFRPPASGTYAGNIAIRASFGDPVIAVTGVGDRSLATHYYRSILRREPDAGGVEFWNAEAARIEAAGANVVEVWYALAMSFFNSAEYRAFNRDDNAYLTDLYRTFFDRAPDDAGVAYWMGQIGQGLPREVVLISFMFSTEFQNRAAAVFGTVPVPPEMDIAIDFYRGLLGRLPDTAGLTYWAGRFRAAQCQGSYGVYSTATEVSRSFVLGPEYVARNRTTAQFVADLYNAFLRRGGELAGVQFWISRLDGGAISRETATSQFAQLAEFQARAGRIAAGCYL
jgi:hypothetical protein